MKNNISQIKTTPTLRFPGFSGAWEEKKINEVCKITTGSSDTQDRVPDGKYPFYVRSNTIEKSNEYLFDGEAILTSGDGVGVGKNFHYINGKFNFHQRVYSLNSFDSKYNGKFIYNVFSTKFYNRVKRMSAKNSVDSVRMEMIADMRIFFPVLEEQEKIADFLGAVDSWIGNLKKQKENLELYKKGMMQKIFSQEIRFKKEGGRKFEDWRKKTLGSLCQIKKGKQLNRLGLSDSIGYPVINGGVEPSGYSDFFSEQAGSITISEGGNSCGYVNYIASDFWCGGHCYVLKNLAIDVFFALHYLRLLQKKIMRLRVGSGLPNIQKKDLEKIIIYLPEVDEQKKIADFLSSIDNMVELKQKQIAKAENWKKGLMQKLFV